MMSCGCPVVDLDVDLALAKYGNDENNIFLLDPLPDRFALELQEILYNDELLTKHRNSALEWVKNEFPSEYEMAKIVEDCIVTKLKTGAI